MTKRQVWLQSQMNKAQVQEDWASVTALASLIWRDRLEEGGVDPAQIPPYTDVQLYLALRDIERAWDVAANTGAA